MTIACTIRRRQALRCAVAITLWATAIPRLAGEPAETDLRDRAAAGMRKAAAYWSGTVASQGGYVWEYSTDLVTRRRGESGDLDADVAWVQAGTPDVGQAYLTAYRATGEAIYLDAAVAAARCLVFGQLESGGWDYRIDRNIDRAKLRYHHLGDAGRGFRNTSTFDDDNTQSATRFLMAVDALVDDDEIRAAVGRALDGFLRAQYEGGAWDGAWPQRHPPPEKGYGALPTFNDNTMTDCVRTMLAAWKQYGDPRYRDSVLRCLEFYLRSRRPAPQAVWPQQVDRELNPAWARKFEPPSVSSAESRGNCVLLLDMYTEFGDARYRDAVGEAVDWFRRSRIEGTGTSGVWARFYEPETNRPLYFTRTYDLTYRDDDLPVHYSFKGGYGIDSLIRRYESVRGETPEDLRTVRDAAKPRTPKEEDIRKILAALDETGRWTVRVPRREQVRDKEGRVSYVEDTDAMLTMMMTRTFNANLRALAAFVGAER